MGQNLFGQLTANAANTYGGLEPALAAQAYAPSGYTPAQKASMNTAAQQSAGGSNAGAVGSGGLYAARTRNAGGAQAAIGASNRAAGENLSRQAVNTEVQSANLAQKNRQAALGGLEGIYGTDVNAGNRALETSNQALQGASQSAADNPWLKILMQGMSAAGNAASGGAFGTLGS